MTPHDHRVFVPGCYRCELGRDEAMEAEKQEGATVVKLAGNPHVEVYSVPTSEGDH